jgi:Plasmid pRiA4b ORF-3-like protein
MIQLADAGGGRPLYQLKIVLCDCKPPIWRRIVVRADMKLDRLHRVIQVAMGWTDSHLHHFVADGVYYGKLDREGDAEDPQMLNEKRYTVDDLAPTAKARFAYEYDFGDSWEHEVVLEKDLPPNADFKHPVCLGGANSCPTEDCGGSPGYAQFVAVMADPKHEEHAQLKEWCGGAWDATRFSLRDTQAGLKRLKA